MTISAPAEGMPQIAPEQKNVVKLVVATSLGNALEWFDISVYAYFAVYLSKAFFPANGSLRFQPLGTDYHPPDPGRPLWLTGSGGAKPPKVTFYSGPVCASIAAAIQRGEEE